MIARKSAVLGIAIVGFWLVTMGLLVSREILPSLSLSRAHPAALQPFDDWYGIYLADNTYVGTFHMSAVPEARSGEEGLKFVADGRIVLNLLESSSDMAVRAVMWVPSGAGETPFAASVSTGDHSFQLDGAIEDGTLRANMKTAGQTFPVEWPVGDAFNPTEMLAPATAFAELQPGESMSVPAFDPVRLANGVARVACLREEAVDMGSVSVNTRVYDVSLGGMTSTVWLDDSGDVMQVQTPYGFTLRRITAEDAVAPAASAQAGDLLKLAAVVPTGRRPFRGARRMVARLSGYDELAAIPQERYQQVESDTLTLVTPTAPRAGSDATERVDDHGEHLGSDPFIPSDHPVIVSRAQEIIATADGPWPQAQRLYQWVYENIAKVPVPSVPSALDVLQTREGDCNEHTVLFTALARAVAIPTRVAVGVVWSEELQAFYYHAWPEVFAGAWIPVDPTLGQPIADATHIKLIEGNIERWPRLVAYLGRLKIEVLEVQ